MHVAKQLYLLNAMRIEDSALKSPVSVKLTQHWIKFHRPQLLTTEITRRSHGPNC